MATSMPELVGWSNVSLSVRDRGRSAAFYADVLGFEIFEPTTHEAFDEYVLSARTGADHLAFRVATRAALDDRSAGLPSSA